MEDAFANNYFKYSICHVTFFLLLEKIDIFLICSKHSIECENTLEPSQRRVLTSSVQEKMVYPLYTPVLLYKIRGSRGLSFSQTCFPDEIIGLWILIHVISYITCIFFSFRYENLPIQYSKNFFPM